MDNPLARHGGLSYLEIPASDPTRSATFYERVVGWRIDKRGERDLRFTDGDGLLLGRFVDGAKVADGAGFVPIVYVVDLGAAVERVGDAGGDVVQAPRAEGDVWVARVRDPAGNVLGLWELGTR
jgi:predicted enzyme related to lactoylglutathione lyase